MSDLTRHGEDVNDYSMCLCGLPAGYCSTDECERCEGTGDRYGRGPGGCTPNTPATTCPDCHGTGRQVLTLPPAPTTDPRAEEARAELNEETS